MDLNEIDLFSSQNRRYKLPFEIRIMQPILRFLQLLCENHNPEFQVWIFLHLLFIILFFLFRITSDCKIITKQIIISFAKL
jgi:hypothetical protein